ncbi:hypothetical protein MHYP_G00155370 [Metynnis hypsauchen]
MHISFISDQPGSWFCKVTQGSGPEESWLTPRRLRLQKLSYKLKYGFRSKAVNLRYRDNPSISDKLLRDDMKELSSLGSKASLKRTEDLPRGRLAVTFM